MRFGCGANKQPDNSAFVFGRVKGLALCKLGENTKGRKKSFSPAMAKAQKAD
jgi:hypothetical protein